MTFLEIAPWLLIFSFVFAVSSVALVKNLAKRSINRSMDREEIKNIEFIEAHKLMVLISAKTEIMDALGNGQDEDIWKPGESWINAAVRAILKSRKIGSNGMRKSGTETNHDSAISAIDVALADAERQEKEEREWRETALELIGELRTYIRVWPGLKLGMIERWDAEIARLKGKGGE